MSINKRYGVSDELYSSVMEVLAKHKGTPPRNEKEKKLAAMHGDPNVITHGDVLKARGVKMKEETSQVDKIEEASTIRFTTKGNDWTDNKEKVTAIHKSLRKAHPDKVAKAFGGGPDNAGYVTVKKKEYLDTVKKHIIKAGGTIKENKDTPGNSYAHQCAIHVKNEEWGVGRTITTQHADPDQDGNIAWYDVMFEHGIEKQVPTSTLEILVFESHMHSKRKKKAM